MDSDVAPERGLSSSMDLYSHEGEGEGGEGRAFAPRVSRIEPAGLRMPWPGRPQAQEAPKTVPGTLRSCTRRFQTENASATFLLLGRPRLSSSPSSTSSSSSLLASLLPPVLSLSSSLSSSSSASAPICTHLSPAYPTSRPSRAHSRGTGRFSARKKKRRMLDRQEAEGVQNTRGVLEEKTVL